jgi:flavorubredoxin
MIYHRLLLLLLLLVADVLECAGAAIEWVVPKSEGTIPITGSYSLTAVLTPTPRWPDAMCIIDPASKVVFTSKLFSAHVAPGLLNSKVRGGLDSHTHTIASVYTHDMLVGTQYHQSNSCQLVSTQVAGVLVSQQVMTRFVPLSSPPSHAFPPQS